MHRRSGEQVSGTSVLEILHRERMNKVFGKRLARLLQVLHHGSSFVQVRYRGEPSSATSADALIQQDCLRPVISVRLPKSQGSVRNLFFIQFLIIFSELIILLCLATSMIELFMLDLVMFMIYLFRNLIMQLPNISTEYGTCMYILHLKQRNRWHLIRANYC